MYRNTVLPEYVFKAYVGDYVDLKKMREVFERAVQIGTVADVLEEKREKEFQRLLEKMKKDSVEISVEVAKAVSKTLPLAKRVEVVKTSENVKKPLILELPKIALHGENPVLRKLMSWNVLRGMMVNGEL
jgi:hypothetical protein